MHKDLSVETKQSFQVVALLATILVVGIHYKSAVPDLPSPHDATWNQLAQEFLFGGLARVAVPLFAFSAGLFYFRRDDGSWTGYRQQVKRRFRTLAVPYLIVASIATISLIVLSWVQHRPWEWSYLATIERWLLHPPAEQLWFVRDLMLLILIAPVIRYCCTDRSIRPILVSALLVLWGANAQVFPIVSGWHLIHIETLLFFTIGCLAVMQPRWIEGIGRVNGMTVASTVSLWCMLVATRITVKADFDIWYVKNHGAIDLMLHQCSILVGCIATYMIAFRLRHPRLLRLSGASFFVYLIHEFPLRAVVRRLADQIMNHDLSSWVVTPTVLVGCFGAALLLERYALPLYQLLTGGRTVARATALVDSHPARATAQA